MTEPQYLMGVDFGTGGVRVGIFDPLGDEVGYSSVEYGIRYPNPGWAEQDPEHWWIALTSAVPAAMSDGRLSPGDIAGVSVDATASTVVAVDRAGRPLRKAIMWMDVRASEQAERISRTEDPALKYNGYGAASPEFGLPKALWIRDNEPHIYQEARYILDCADWITHRLTGRETASINTASSKYYFDRDNGGWPAGLFEAVGAKDLLERFPSEVLDVGAVVGGLLPSVAQELGLRSGTVVTEASVDCYAGALGLGVIEPGSLALITGSSHCMIAQSAHPIYDTGFWGAYTDVMVPGLYTIEAGQAATGSLAAWIQNELGGSIVEQARARGVHPYEVFDEMARGVPIGSDGLVMLDYFQGNRSPHTDPRARGAISGLTLSHGIAHLFRAAMESVCFGTEEILESMRRRGLVPSQIVASGGPAGSELWMQMHADVSNVPIAFSTVVHGPVLGAAISASVGAGIHPDLRTAVRKMVRYSHRLEPSSDRHEQYRFWLERYRELYPAVRDVQHKVLDHVSGTSLTRHAKEGGNA